MFVQIDGFLNSVNEGLEGIIRWEKYVKDGATPENDLQHSFSTVLLTILILEVLEQNPPGFEYNKYKILACAALHDVGEINVGDTLYKYKNKVQVSKELDSFSSQVAAFPTPIKKSLKELYLLQYKPSDGIFSDNEPAHTNGEALIFEFIERSGYLLYAVHEYEKNMANVKLLVQVIRNQKLPLLKLLDELPAGRNIFTDDFLSWMDSILEEHQNEYIEV